jgi:tRNA-intron endonuclease
LPEERSPAKGVLAGIRVIVFDAEEARRIYSLGFYGKPLGIPKPRGADFDAPLELGLMEALYLVEKGLLIVEDLDGHPYDADRLRNYARGVVEGFDYLYTVYRDLRERGLVVRSGLKYGADFAVYEKGPGLEHAPYLVHVVPHSSRIEPLEIVRAGRLSHSVRKSFVIALVESPASPVKYLAFEWSRL